MSSQLRSLIREFEHCKSKMKELEKKVEQLEKMITDHLESHAEKENPVHIAPILAPILTLTRALIALIINSGFEFGFGLRRERCKHRHEGVGGGIRHWVAG